MCSFEQGSSEVGDILVSKQQLIGFNSTTTFYCTSQVEHACRSSLEVALTNTVVAECVLLHHIRRQVLVVGRFDKGTALNVQADTTRATSFDAMCEVTAVLRPSRGESNQRLTPVSRCLHFFTGVFDSSF